MIADECVRDEGTSGHYISSETVVRSHAGLRDTLIHSAETLQVPVAVGGQWTTDAIYRESIDDIDRYRKRGILGVDMETSAMCALGQVRGVDVANILAVSDEMWRAWNPAFGSERLELGLTRACDIALDAACR